MVYDSKIKIYFSGVKEYRVIGESADDCIEKAKELFNDYKRNHLEREGYDISFRGAIADRIKDKGDIDDIKN